MHEVRYILKTVIAFYEESEAYERLGNKESGNVQGECFFKARMCPQGWNDKRSERRGMRLERANLMR